MIQHGGTKEDFKNDFSFGYVDVRILQPTPAEWDQLLERKLKRMEVKGTNLAQYIEAGYLQQLTIATKLVHSSSDLHSQHQPYLMRIHSQSRKQDFYLIG